MKFSLWQAGMMTLLLTWMVSLALVLSSPERFIDSIIEGDSFVSETTRTLALNDKFYLLEPHVRLASRLDQLDYIESYTIERTLPNKVTIRYLVERPLACSTSTIYYAQSRFDRWNRNTRLCDEVIEIQGSDPDTLLVSLQLLDQGTRNLIERIEFQVNEALVTLKNGQQVIVYPTDLQGLERIVMFAPRNEVIDLRRNYA
jgi:hypothetical protein